MLPAGLRPFSDDPGGSALLLDFDGTLSPIAATPASARPAPGVVESLERLAAVFRLVAVVTGRRAADAAALVGKRIRVLGLYGAEDTLRERGLPGAGAPLVGEVRAAIGGVTGAWVEEKGSHLAVHYRAAPKAERARSLLEEALVPVARRHGLELFHGKRVLELAPAGAPTKGDTVRTLAAEHEGALRRMLFVGDTDADLDAFRALDGLDGVDGFKIAVRAAETPPALIEAADLVVDGVQRVSLLLEDLVGATASD